MKIGKGQQVGSDFWVLHHYHDDFNSLGGGMIRFTPNERYDSLATPHFETRQFAWKSDIDDADFPIVQPSSGAILDRIATEAISQMAPTKPKADLASFMGELREGLPHAIGIRDSSKQRIARARNAGDEYLNVEFGWKPLLRDLRKFADSHERSAQILDAYHSKSGVLLRRERRLPIEQTVDVQKGSVNLPVPVLATANYGTGATSGSYTKTTKTTTERWVVAAFTYTVPPDDRLHRLERRRSDMNQLYGSNITPNMLWNMAPWTWAADWVADGGSIAANLSYLGTDGLTMPYCYVMETKSVKVTHEIHCGLNFFRTYPNSRPYFMQSLETVSKYRKSGTPFGFGLNWSGFSAKQLSILAALGISKGS